MQTLAQMYPFTDEASARAALDAPYWLERSGATLAVIEVAHVRAIAAGHWLEDRRTMHPVAEESGATAVETSVRCGAGCAHLDAETLAADQQPHYPHAGYTTDAGIGGWLWKEFA